MSNEKAGPEAQTSVTPGKQYDQTEGQLYEDREAEEGSGPCWLTGSLDDGLLVYKEES